MQVMTGISERIESTEPLFSAQALAQTSEMFRFVVKHQYDQTQPDQSHQMLMLML
jgi:hypothetical protein